jgi:hypothetical protein
MILDMIVDDDADDNNNWYVNIFMLGMELFNTKEVIIIPFVFGVDDDRQIDADKEKGFGKRDLLMTAAYIAKPKQLSVWWVQMIILIMSVMMMITMITIISIKLCRKTILQSEVDIAEQGGNDDDDHNNDHFDVDDHD